MNTMILVVKKGVVIHGKMTTVAEVSEKSKNPKLHVSWIHRTLKEFEKEGFDLSNHQGKQGTHKTLDDLLIEKLKERGGRND